MIATSPDHAPQIDTSSTTTPSQLVEAPARNDIFWQITHGPSALWSFSAYSGEVFDASLRQLQRAHR